jgi:hypothetical protein
MAKQWTNNVKHVQAGEPVRASTVSRPDKALEGNVTYVRDRLDAAALGRTVFDNDAVISPDLLEGQPVFWNYETLQYEAAFAAVEPDPTTGTLAIQPSADCLGLLYSKKSARTGDIILFGIVKLPQLTNAIDGTIEAGRYYLSAAEPGKLVKQRPPVTVAVCYVQGPKDNCSDDPWVIVSPQVRNFLDDHIHYRFSLTCLPAGTHSAGDALSEGRHVITDPDPGMPGWLPADHTSFSGKAPTGAAFGYNFAEDPALQNVWPPVPLQAVAVLWDKGLTLSGAVEVPLGPTGLVVCDANGIWWMSDCYADVPWPAEYDNTSGSSSSESLSSSSAGEIECPRNEVMRVEVVYLRMVFGNDRSVVTSLQPGPDSPITVVNCDGVPAVTGDLKLGLDLQFLIDPILVSGGLVFKELTNNLRFKLGYVTEGLIAGDDSITLNGSVQRPVSTTDATVVHQGLVTLAVNLEPTDRDLAPQIVRLADAVERLYKDVPYIGFPEGQDASVRLRINIPPAGLPVSPLLKIRTLVFGRVAATLPELTMTYRRLPQPVIGTPAALPTADTAVTFNAAVAIGLDQMVTIESESFTVAAGDTVLVTIARASDSGYNGEVGIIRWGGILLGG